MTRILFITRHLRVGGAQRNWTILLPGLAERGLDPRLVTLEQEGELFALVTGRGVPARCLGMRGPLDLVRLRSLGRSGGWRPEVIVSHDERSHVVGRLLADHLKVSHVASDHGGPGFRLKPHQELVLRLVAPGFAGALTMSAQRVDDLARRGFHRERIWPVANGVDAYALQPRRGRGAVRASLGLADDDVVALLPAVLRPEKRPERFVRAVAQASRMDPRVRGLLAGYGPCEERVRRLAASTGRAVEVLGHRDDIPDLIAAADVVCLTSDVEGAPFAALEAMALGRPVAAMRAGALDEVVVDGETGVLVAAGDVQGLAEALVGLAERPERRRALGAAGRERQRAHFDAGRMCDVHARLLRAAARSSTASSAWAATSTE